MDFSLNDTHQLVQRTARDYAQTVIRPAAATIDSESRIPPEILGGLADLGLLGVNTPEDLGGAGAGVISYVLAMREIAGACASTAVTMAVTNMTGEVITSFGSAAQKAKYNPLLCSGEMIGAFALSEVDAGSDPAGMRMTARRDGDFWVLDGSKQWITTGDTAGVMVVWARTEGDGPKGLSCFLVEGGTPGLSVAGVEDKMGLRGSHTCSLLFEDCRLPFDALLGAEGDGFRIAMMALDGGRIGIGAQAVGIGEAALAAAIAYAKERQQFGKPIARFQAIEWMIADSRAELDAAWLLILRAAFLKERGAVFSREAAMGKVYGSEAAWRVCNRAVQIFGGYGYTREFPVERFFRDVRVTQIYEGTSEIQRLVIGRSVLKD